MKPMSMLLGGILVSSIALMAVAQQNNRPHSNPHPGHLPGPTATQPAHGNAPHAPPFVPPMPRGNLRGDIASNAKGLQEPTRNDVAPRGR